MTTQNARITGLSSVLQGPINPAGFNAAAAAPIELTWRSAPSGKYVIALNLSVTRTSQRISLTGITLTSATVVDENRTVTVTNGVVTDTFGPYAVHVYQFAE